MMRGSQARSSLPQGWSQTVESRINIGLDKERDFPRTVAVVDEREKERDRYTSWLHREVQGRVAGPVVQLRFISLFPWSSADQQQ